MPAAPKIALKILELVDKEASSTRELAAVIARDQTLTARVLQLANSAFFGLRSGLNSIPQAVTLLGFARVRDIAVAVSSWNALEAPGVAGRGFRRRLWAHSAAVAIVAKALAERAGGDPAHAYTAGLLHDVGKLVLWSHLGERYRCLLEEAAASGETVSAHEEGAFGCDHGVVGGWLLQVWGLPPALVGPVSTHHAPLQRGHLEVSALVAIGDALVNATDPHGAVSPKVLSQVSSAVPGLVTEDGWRTLYGSIRAEREAVEALLGPE